MSATAGGNIKHIDVQNGSAIWMQFVTNSDIRIRDGYQFRIYDSADADWMQLDHDGTDFNFGAKGVGTVDVNFTGISGAYTFDASLTASDFNGVSLTTGGLVTDFLNATGTYTAPGGGGNVSNTGVPSNNQLAIWTNTTTIEGDDELSYDGALFELGSNSYMHLRSTIDASLSSTTHPLQIGLTSGPNMIFDRNEIISRDNGAAATMNLNITGANVIIGSTTANDTSIMLGERTTPSGNLASRGQFWVFDDVPNLPMFTGDTGDTTHLHPGISEINEQNGNYTCVMADMGKTIYKASGGALETITIPSNASVPYPIGAWITIDNDGGDDLDIDLTTDVMIGTDSATGNRVLGNDQIAVLHKVTATRWRYAATDL